MMESKTKEKSEMEMHFFSNGVDPEDDDDDRLQDSLKQPSLQRQNEERPLDNYYYRKMRKQQSSHQENTMLPKVPLIIGGSDGSGTRAFVDVLSRLGVPMLVDNTDTMDVHASKAFFGKGWPPFAHLALKYSPNHSPNYQISDLPQNHQRSIQKELLNLRQSLTTRHAKLLKNSDLFNAKHNRTNPPVAKSISYGFKAPITMLLLPMLQAYLYPDTGFRYLHIVRDGRDVAFSSNQSPVTKFYNSTYPETAMQRLQQYHNISHVLGIQLWNHWNAELYDWEQRQSSLDDPNPGFQFLVMRTEDLLQSATRFEALQMLADFVGSSLTPRALCCMSRTSIADLGQSNPMRNRGAGARRSSSTTQFETTSMGSDERYRDFMQRKQEFLKNLAILAGKASPKEMTAKERLHAMLQFQQMHSNKNENTSSNHSLEQSESRQDITQEHGLLERHLDPDIANFVGRRLLQSAPNSEHPIKTFSSTTLNSSQHVLKSARRVDRGEGDSNVYNQWHQRVISMRLSRNKLDFGDEELGKRLTCQLEVLKRVASKQSNRAVEERYGKWSSLLASAPALSEAMHREGARALQLFGYHPPRRFMDQRPFSENSFVCDERVVCLEDTVTETS